MLKHLEQETDVLLRFALTPTKLNTFRPYNIKQLCMSSNNQIVRQKFVFAHGCCKMCSMEPWIHSLCLWLYKPWFHISRHVNAQNARIWKSSCCSGSLQWIIGRIYFHKTVNSDRYVSDILIYCTDVFMAVTMKNAVFWDVNTVWLL
jgi:hypothetical protein